MISPRVLISHLGVSHSPDSTPQRLPDILYLLAAGFTFLGCFAIGSQILRLAPELSDASFYVLNLRHPEQIENQLSMFGIIWFSLFGQTSLVTARVIHAGLVFGSGALLALRYAKTQTQEGRSVRWALSIIAGCSFLSTFTWVLIDPNYNSLILIWFSLALVFAPPFLERPRPNTFLPSLGAGIGFGAAIFLLALTKITGAAAAAVFFLLVYGTVHAGRFRAQSSRYTQIKAFLLLFGSTLLGFAAVISVLAARGFSPGTLWARFDAGREVSERLGVHSISLELITDKAQAYFAFLLQAFQIHWDAAALVALLSVNAALAVHLQFRGNASLASLVFGLLAALAGVFALQKGISANSALAHFQLAAVLRWCALLMTAYLIWLSAAEKRTAMITLLCTAALGPFILVVGTTNAWAAQFSLYSGLAMAALCVALAQCPTEARIQLFPASAALLVCLFLATGQYMQTHPYRQGAQLDQAQVPISYGPERILLHTTPALARAYQPLEKARKIFERETSAPVLLDITGRAPGVAAYLNATLPQSAWILSGYPGSNDVFGDVLDRLTASTLRKAWLLMPTYSGSGAATLDTSILEARLFGIGRSLDDYESVAQIDIVYVDIKATLLRPKTQ